MYLFKFTTKPALDVPRPRLFASFSKVKYVHVLVPVRNDDKGVLLVGSISVAKLPSCHAGAIMLFKCIKLNKGGLEN